MDGAWLQVAALASTGSLAFAKVSTRVTVEAGGFARHVICVYTSDWQDLAEVRRMRELLRAVGFGQLLGYKRDRDTAAGVDTMVYEE